MNKCRSAQSSRLLSISEVAWLLGVDNSRVCRAVRVGLLPVVRRGRRLLIPARALADLANNDDLRTDPNRAGSIGRGDAR